MRIGIFTDTYPPYINGVSTSVAMLQGALEKKGHEVFIVTVNADNMSYKYENENRIIELAFERGVIQPEPPKLRTGKTVAVIGSGPSGLPFPSSAASKLFKRFSNFDSVSSVAFIPKYLQIYSNGFLRALSQTVREQLYMFGA